MIISPYNIKKYTDMKIYIKVENTSFKLKIKNKKFKQSSLDTGAMCSQARYKMSLIET